MEQIEVFQKTHGAEWAKICGSDAFNSAMLLAHQETLDDIVKMPDEQVASPLGNVALAELRGMLKHEERLVKLSVLQPEIEDLPEPTYSEPEEEETKPRRRRKRSNEE